MSVAGISSSLISSLSQPQNRFQQFRQDFQQLGQDLQAGNLSAAQSDFTTLQQLTGQNSSASQSSHSISQDFSQLGQDLQAGNLTAAQQDFSTITQDIQKALSQGQVQGHHRHHHHHHEGGGDSSQASAIQQAFSDLGQALQAGNLSDAQKAYTSIQQDFQQFAINGGAPNSVGSSGSTGGTVNTTA
jgi:outer membrane protein assembly factor BamD (BamD/ComL family)